MAYEVETIAPNASAIPSQQPPIMREDRVIDPYRGHIKPLKKSPEIGQSNTGVDAKPAIAAEPGSIAPAESVNLSPAAAALARKEQKFRQEQLRLNKDRESLEAERQELAELKEMKAKLAAKDFSAIESQVPYDEYTNYQVNKLNGQNPEQERIGKVEKELADLKQRSQTDAEKRFEAAVNDRREAVKTLVLTDARFAGIKELKAEEAVVRHILDTFENDGINLSPEQAAKEVEDVIKERAKRWSGLYKAEPQEIPPAADKPRELPPLKPGVNTLTNNMAPVGEIKRPPRSFQGMSDNERWAEARRRAEEKLKKG